MSHKLGSLLFHAVLAKVTINKVEGISSLIGSMCTLYVYRERFSFGKEVSKFFVVLKSFGHFFRHFKEIFFPNNNDNPNLFFIKMFYPFSFAVAFPFFLFHFSLSFYFYPHLLSVLTLFSDATKSFSVDHTWDVLPTPNLMTPSLYIQNLTSLQPTPTRTKQSNFWI